MPSTPGCRGSTPTIIAGAPSSRTVAPTMSCLPANTFRQTSYDSTTTDEGPVRAQVAEEPPHEAAVVGGADRVVVVR